MNQKSEMLCLGSCGGKVLGLVFESHDEGEERRRKVIFTDKQLLAFHETSTNRVML